MTIEVFAKYSFIELPEKTPNKYFFAVYGSFHKIDVFPLVVFFISNFNLCYLKSSINEAILKSGFNIIGLAKPGHEILLS